MATFDPAAEGPAGDPPDDRSPANRPDDGPDAARSIDIPDDISGLFPPTSARMWPANDVGDAVDAGFGGDIDAGLGNDIDAGFGNDIDAERGSDIDAGFGGDIDADGVPASDLDDVVAVLDSPDLVRARDPGRLLWALATAGAQVRRAVGVTTTTRWDADQPPRAVLVVTDASVSVSGAVLAHLGGPHAAVLDWRGAELPRWAGPADVLLAASVDGMHPRVATLLAEADRRGLTVVAVSPHDSPVAAAAGRGVRVPIDPPTHRRAALWTVLTPLLLAARELGVVRLSDQELADIAAGLDAVAEACRPGTDAFSNAAKQLAVEVTEADLVVVGCGPLSTLAARWMSDSLALIAGLGALALSLPDDVAEAGSLLQIAPSGTVASTQDFFRDRIDEPTRRRRLLVLPEYGPSARDIGGPAPFDTGSTGTDLHDLAATRAAGVLQDIATARGIATSTPELAGQTALARFAAATAFGDFLAAYAAIGRGVDPGAIRAGEIPF